MSKSNSFVDSNHEEVVALVNVMSAVVRHKQVCAPVGDKWLKKKKKKGGK